MYWHPVFYFTLFYFVVGAAFIGYINSRTQAGKQERWIKFGVYILIVHTILFSILYTSTYFAIIAVAIALAGAVELIRAWTNSGRKPQFLFISLLIYLLFASGFVLFSMFGIHKAWVYLLVVTFDGFSQITGQAFGRKKLVPKISPGKTVEGFAGGILTTVVTALIISLMGIWISPLAAIITGAVISLFAFTGDIIASYYKRKTGIKDFGTSIPGHGGILDRFDSFIATGGFVSLILLIRSL